MASWDASTHIKVGVQCESFLRGPVDLCAARMQLVRHVLNVENTAEPVNLGLVTSNQPRTNELPFLTPSETCPQLALPGLAVDSITAYTQRVYT